MEAVPSHCGSLVPDLGREIDGRAISYLDNGATTLKPRSVIQAVCGYYESNGVNVHRGAAPASPRDADALQSVRWGTPRPSGTRLAACPGRPSAFRARQGETGENPRAGPTPGSIR
ncbi:aminotransferase class V-fold PLP-dependent enzyme [Streptomyces sp. NPDC006197]|uniref:aminotransferase class V-fold PLP-dependent enzyme n=1 Tax=Streptomyces sp. NPDC006197 TaxID=3156685 RepID=UPI0033A2EC12